MHRITQNCSEEPGLKELKKDTGLLSQPMLAADAGETEELPGLDADDIDLDLPEFFYKYGDLSMKQFVHVVLLYSVEWFYRRTSQNDKTRNFRTPLYEMVYLMRGRPELVDLEPFDAWERFNDVANSVNEEWALEFNITPDDAETEFLVWWERIENILGRSFLKRAVDHALTSGPLHIRLKKRRPEKYHLFLAVAKHLQELKKGEPFVIDTYGAEWGLLGVSQKTVWNWSCWAKEDGFLTQTFKGTPGGKRASEFKFQIPEFSIPVTPAPVKSPATKAPTKPKPESARSPETQDSDRGLVNDIRPPDADRQNDAAGSMRVQAVEPTPATIREDYAAEKLHERYGGDLAWYRQIVGEWGEGLIEQMFDSSGSALEVKRRIVAMESRAA